MMMNRRSPQATALPGSMAGSSHWLHARTPCAKPLVRSSCRTCLQRKARPYDRLSDHVADQGLPARSSNRPALVDEPESFGALLDGQARTLAQPRRERAALIHEIVSRFVIERLAIGHRIVEQPACEMMAYRRAPRLVAVGDVFVDERTEAFVDAHGCVLERPRRGSAHGREHTGERPAPDVVERVGRIAAGLHELLLITGNANEHAEFEQRPTDRDEFASFVLGAQRKVKPVVAKSGSAAIEIRVSPNNRA